MTEEAFQNIEAARKIEHRYFPGSKNVFEWGEVDVIIENHPLLKLNEYKYLPRIVELVFDDWQNGSCVFDRYIDVIMSLIKEDPQHENIPAGHVYGVIDYFEEGIISYVRDRKILLDDIKYEQHNDYRVKLIKSFADAAGFRSFADWCISDNLSDYNAYTNGGEQFYFCMRSGFESEPRVLKEGFPWDDYGKSLVAVSVDRYGLLANVTSRWNLESNGIRKIDDEVLSRMIGRNFYDVFLPCIPHGIMYKQEKTRRKN